MKLQAKSNINESKHPVRILVAPLDWGLGHATRCIPLIKAIQLSGNEVIIGASGRGAELLKRECPDALHVYLPGYRIDYSKNPSFFLLKLLAQMPKLILTFLRSRKRLHSLHEQYHFNLVISDNRPEMFSKEIPSIYITHQLNIETGRSFLSMIVNRVHCFFINKFSECWVPDEDKNSLAGKLSHPQKMPSVPVSYIGCLSRFENKTAANGSELLIMLSGPEPQRTLIEKKIIDEISRSDMKATILRGLPGETKSIPSSEKITFHNHLDSSDLCHLMESAGMVIARCGYSTVMDLATLGKKAILIPTPGQTEQEYLSRYLKEKKYFYTVSQDEFSLEKDIGEAATFPFVMPEVKGLNKSWVEERIKNL